MNLLIFGLGYCGRAIAQAALAAGYSVTATTRSAEQAPMPGGALIPFNRAAAAIAAATHVITTAAPDEHGDPVLARYREALAAAANLRWLGYLSTTGVYGDANGAWVDETSPPNPGAERTRRRVAAEWAWRNFTRSDDAAALTAGPETDQPLGIAIFRLAGIYGPGRSMFDDLRAGQGRHVVRPGHLFGRIHRDDIAQGVLAAMRQEASGIFNFADDEPAASADVLCEAARLLGVVPPPPVPFAQAVAAMSPMARSFWADNRKVCAARTKRLLGIAWRYPSYREGLAAILGEEGGGLNHPHQK
ncbi:NAD-dependent epimerase/dehydratase family protein [Acidocella sp.]|uniref:NAD-dependent epimerase/dehydratase family protein n=1 Tax=Acidocella sp. TaxID=50710 RepID=UPI00260C419E|nr:NAD-dependent epimerase/dehydratase family protein [Acidocella sp.]